MQRRDFLRAVLDRVRADLPPALGAFRAEPRNSIGKLWHGNRALHYECAIHLREGNLEVGLHFEADPLTNARLLGRFRARERGLRRRLGAGVRVEEWDRGWARVWEAHPAAGLDEALCAEFAVRMACYVTVLEPILRAELPADVSWRPASPR